MCGCPLVCKKISNGFEHVIGCDHVSGLGFAALHMPQVGMEMRGSGPNQKGELEALHLIVVFLLSI